MVRSCEPTVTRRSSLGDGDRMLRLACRTRQGGMLGRRPPESNALPVSTPSRLHMRRSRRVVVLDTWLCAYAHQPGTYVELCTCMRSSAFCAVGGGVLRTGPGRRASWRNPLHSRQNRSEPGRAKLQGFCQPSPARPIQPHAKNDPRERPNKGFSSQALPACRVLPRPAVPSGPPRHRRARTDRCCPPSSPSSPRHAGAINTRPSYRTE